MTSRFGAWLLLISATICVSMPLAAESEIKNGDKLQTLANLHPDMSKRLLYTLNYQLAGLIPVCADVTVKKITNKAMVFVYENIEYEMTYEKYTKEAGVSFQKAAQTYFGAACDKARIQSLGKLDQDGILTGKPSLGMTRQGILFAMGRPPYHANPNLDAAAEWMYWKNRFGKTAIQFDDKGKVINIR